MIAIEIRWIRRTRVLRPVERPVPEPGAERGPRPRARGRRQPARPDAAAGTVSAAARRVGHSRPRARRHRRRRRPGRSTASRRAGRPATRSARWSPAAATPSTPSAPVAAVPAGSGRHGSRQRGGHSRDLLHGLDQRLPARPAARPARRCSCTAASSGIGTTAIQLARAFGATVYRHRRIGREMRGVRDSSARTRPSTTRPRISSTRSRTLTSGRGVDVILDIVGGDYLARNLRPRRSTAGWCRSACRAAPAPRSTWPR